MATDPWELLWEARNELADLWASTTCAEHLNTPCDDCSRRLTIRIDAALEEHNKPVSLTWEPDENKQPIQYADYGKLTLTVGYYPSPTTTYPWVWSIIGKAYLRGGCSPTEEEAKAEAIKTVRSLA